MLYHNDWFFKSSHPQPRIYFALLQTVEVLLWNTAWEAIASTGHVALPTVLANLL